ncbi:MULTISPECIES: hypothetical protein [unclassified Chitinophaga]|uniref:hypothetical protein n=1 Tax=unclassified Chitinophaga TaxID=2619133 RepID=UPI00300F84C7
MRTTYYIPGIVLILLFFLSCKKNGELIKATEVVKVTVSAFSTNTAAAFSITINGEAIADSLFNGQVKSKVVALAEGGQHMIVRNHGSSEILIDTLVTLPVGFATITLMQLDPAAPPLLIGKDETVIPDDRKMMAFYTKDTLLPETFGIELYACYYDEITFALLKIDTLARINKIKRGELTGFVMVKDSVAYGSGYLFQPLDAVSGQPLDNLARPFNPAEATGPLLNFDRGPLGTEKYYINDINAIKEPDGRLYAESYRLLSY